MSTTEKPQGQLPTFNDPLLQISFDSPDQRKDKEYGRKILARIYSEQGNVNSPAHWGGRTKSWKETWSWAMGRQSMKEFMDFLGVSDATKALTPVDFTPTRLGPQFVETLVNSMAVNDEYPCVSAIDSSSKDEKQQAKMDALFRMKQAQNIDALQKQSGMQLEPDNVFVPDDEMSAEVYFKLEYRLPKEIDFEQKLENHMAANAYPTLKRRLLRELVALNCAATKIEKMDNGFIGIRKCVPANMVYNFFQADSGKMELSYIGEVYGLKVREVRKRFGQSKSNPDGLDEKKIFDILKNASTINAAANPFSLSWRDSYLMDGSRPYDDYNIPVLDLEIKVFDADYYVSKQDAFGKTNIEPKKGIPKPQSDKATVIKTDKYTVYRGVYAINADTMLYWGYPDVTIKPYMDISESLYSYSINIPNNDGDYVPSLFERALEPIRRYTLALLKMKQCIAAMAPPGITLDVETIRDIDLGNGKGSLSWEQVVKIRMQSGVVLWSSKGLNPLEKNERPPIEGIANSEHLSQLNEFDAIMKAAVADIRSLLGVPQYRDGSDVGDRTSGTLAEGQSQSSFNVTDFITNGFHALIEETLQKICMIEWDNVVLKEKNTKLMDTVFSVEVKMRPTAYEKQLIEQNIAVWSKTIDGNGNPLLTPKDIFYIREIKNFKFQQLYLASTYEARRKQAEQERQNREAANQQSQQATAQQSAQAAAQLQQEKIEFEAQKEDTIAKYKKEEILLDGIMQVYKSGLPIPDEIKTLAGLVWQNIAMPLLQENQQHKQQAVAQQQEEQQEQMMQQQQAASQQQQGGQDPNQQQQMPQDNSQQQIQQ